MTLTAENLGKRFNREWIFKNFNYSFEPGVYAILGPNGSGKSTLLHVLWGQMPASEGSIECTIQGKVISPDELYKHVMIAAPYMDLVEEFTLTEMLNFHFSFKKTRDNKTLGEIADALELTHARDKSINKFSSGMKQRLKLGLAFFSEADLIFLDEPTTNLDKPSVDWYWKNFGQIGGKSVVLIGSNLENEYPASARKIHMHDWKQVTKKG